ncbi:FliM/FliN family flagellar motor switch protein [Mangrovicoccus ximenensis]|uniref:FliM/FliN family flagellar motor switch protein n=1 Tax=Mangrovicoccus ximenensis TaxID=1911570 RepID=UPI0011AE5873|nr:flagellar motor switch protein FliM [Mangrovicoccus ximenensis]
MVRTQSQQMSNETHADLLHRMTSSGRPPPEFGEVSPARALRLALAKAGQEVLSQVVTGSGVEEMKLSIPRIPEHLPEGALVIELEGPRGCKGLLALDKGLVFAITESLTTGRLSSGELSPRPVSRTDAMLCRKFLVMVLTVFAAKLVGHPAEAWATGFVPDELVTDLRRLPVTMEDVPYRMLRMEIDFALGARLGQICIIVPWDGPEPPPLPPEEQPSAEACAGQWRANLERSLLRASVDLTAVLGRARISVESLRALEPGSLVELPGVSMDAAVLEAQDGYGLFRGRLGDFNGFRAMRIDAVLQDGRAEEPGRPQPEEPQMSAAEMIDAMSEASPGDLSLPSFDDEPDPELPPLDLDALEEGGEVPDFGGEGFPAMDLGDLNMDDLDDLPESID